MTMASYAEGGHHLALYYSRGSRQRERATQMAPSLSKLSNKSIHSDAFVLLGKGCGSFSLRGF
jgi:hypothetical protein